MASRFFLIVLASLAAQAASGTLASAQWASNGVPLCVTAGAQSGTRSAPDSAGGAIVVWVDDRFGSQDIYGQRVTSNGLLVSGWPANGAPVCIASGAQLTPEVAPDGGGGAFVVWQDGRKGPGDADIFIQRISAAGAVQWTANGIALCDTSGIQSKPQIVPDGSGGAIVTWEDQRNGLDSDIYAQRIAANGTRYWPAQGAPVCTAGNDQIVPVCAADGSGGVLVAWEDTRASTTVSDIFVQHLTSAGIPAANWPVGGVAANLTVDLRLAYAPSIVKDAAGGAIVAWEDYRNLSGDIYAVRLTAGGNVAAGWTTGGSVVCDTVNDQVGPFAVSDGAGGAIIVWQDYRGGSARDLYAQRLTATGVRAAGWPTSGAPVCTSAGNQDGPRAVPDGSNGAVVTWYDYRGGIQTDIYAQRITSAGQVAPGWTVNGVALCTAVADQQSPTLVGGSNGGALVAWQDYRNNSDYDIYAQYVTGTGYVPLAVDVPDPGAGLPSFHVQEPRPNPASGVATIAFELPATRTVDARVFDLGGRAVRVLETGRSFSAGAHVLAWDGRDQGGGRVATGVYLVRLTAGSEVQVRRVVRLR